MLFKACFLVLLATSFAQRVNQGRRPTYDSDNTRWNRDGDRRSWTESEVRNNIPPIPYDFNYAATHDDGTTSSREETSDGTTVRGSYSYIDPDGVYRQVDYVADENGYRATIKTNEPGTQRGNSGDPADTVWDVQPPPEAVVAKYGRNPWSITGENYRGTWDGKNWSNDGRRRPIGTRTGLDSEGRPLNRNGGRRDRFGNPMNRDYDGETSWSRGNRDRFGNPINRNYDTDDMYGNRRNPNNRRNSWDRGQNWDDGTLRNPGTNRNWNSGSRRGYERGLGPNADPVIPSNIRTNAPKPLIAGVEPVAATQK